MDCTHDGIKKGNDMYAYYKGDITKDKTLKIKVVKEGAITKDINYIFYASLKLNEKYTFYTIDSSGTETKLSMVFGTPESGDDDEDVHDY